MTTKHTDNKPLSQFQDINLLLLNLKFRQPDQTLILAEIRLLLLSYEISDSILNRLRWLVSRLNQILKLYSRLIPLSLLFSSTHIFRPRIRIFGLVVHLKSTMIDTKQGY